MVSLEFLQVVNKLEDEFKVCKNKSIRNHKNVYHCVDMTNTSPNMEGAMIKY